MAEELGKGTRAVTLSELVAQQTREKTLARFQSVKTKGRMIVIGIIVAIALVVVGVSVLIFTKLRKHRRRRTSRHPPQGLSNLR